MLAGRVQRPVLWFESNPWTSDETGRIRRSETDYTIYGFVDGVPSLLMYVTDSRVATVTFSMLLSPHQLNLATSAMRRARLRRFVLPALKELRRQLKRYGRETPALRAYLRGLLDRRARRTGRRTRTPLRKPRGARA